MANLEIEIGAITSGLDKGLRDAQSKLEGFSKTATRLGKTLSLSVTAPLTALGAISLKSFSDVEKGLREVNTLLGETGDAAEKNFGDFQKIARDVSKEVGILQSDVVPGLYNAISAGVPKDNVFDFLTIAGRASIAGVTDLNTSVDGLTTVINAFGKDFSEAGDVADSVFAAIQGGKTTFEELSKSLFNVAPAAAASGVGMQEINAAIATLTASGTPTSVATTQIRAALVGLQRPSEELDKIFQSLGFQNAELAVRSEGLGFALNAVREATGGSAGELQKLLGSVEAVAAANVLAGNGADKFNTELERQANSAGAANDAFEEVNKSFERQIVITQVALSNLSISIGKILAPTVEKFNIVLQTLINFFDNLSDSAKEVAVVIGAVAAAVGPLLLTVGALGVALPAIKAGALAISAAFTPLVIKILAVTAAVVGLGLVAKGLVDSWGTVTEFFSQLWDKVKILFIDGVTKVLETFNKLTSVIGLDFKDTIDGLKAQSDRISGILDSKPVVTFGDVFSEIGQNIKGTFTGIKDNISKSMDDAKKSIEDTHETLNGLNDDIIKGIGGGASGSSRTQSTAIGGVGDRAPGQFAALDTSGAGLSIPPINEESKSAFLESLDRFNQEASNILSNGVSNVVGDFAFSIGQALGSGANLVDTIGATLLSGIAEIANQLGQASIAIGISMIAIKKAFSNPFTAIAAGVALVALAGVISSQVPKITAGGGGSASGVTGGAGQSFTGSGTNNALVDSFSAIEIKGESKIQGQDIIISYEKAQRANGR